MLSRACQDRVIGDYGEWWFDYEDTFIWKARLTAEGKAKLAEYMALHPHPVGLLKRAWPKVYYGCRRMGFTVAEIDSACMEGMVKGFIRHQEGRAELSTSLAFAVLGTVSDMMRRADRLEELPREFQVTDHWRKSEDAASSEPEAKEEWTPETAEYVAWLVRRANLSKRDYEILTRLIAGDKTLREVAKEDGVSKERIRQIRNRALRKIRHANILEGARV